MTVATESHDAAVEIFERYETWLGDERHGNQDRECCINTIALIIDSHTNPDVYNLDFSIDMED